MTSQRRDYSVIAPTIIGLLCVVAIALVAFAFLRPGPSSAEEAGVAASIRQMDANQAQADAARAEAQKKYVKLLRSGL